MILQHKRLNIMVLTIIILLLIPLVAMQFTTEINWNLLDFVVAAVLLFTTALMCDLVLRKIDKTKYRVLFCAVLLLLFLLLWAELAVGVFGTAISGQ